MTEKDRVLQLIQRMPDTATVDDIMYELYFREVIGQGLAEADAGKVVTLEEAKQRLAKWLEK